ncbi:hypothetical protein F5Y19DRAFT_195895 [Xylariaceae sp. FL1651]|nr:hypothetical protein F5Y19DRAFT_195895 [Xylariaceae sp. FL1651]
MRALLLPPPLLFVLLLQTGSSLAIENDFSSYPQGSQQCLYDSADQAGCTSGSSGAELNQCLCKNHGNFIYNTASCVSQKSHADLQTVYEMLSSNCAGTGVTLSVSEQAFLAAAAAATQTTSTPTSTPMPTLTSTLSPTTTPTLSSSTASSQPPNPTNSDPAAADSGLSTGAKIGIGVGIGFGVIVAGLAAWFIFAYQRRRRSAHSIHSNEATAGGDGPSGYGAGVYGMTDRPRHEFAHDNMQHGAAELAPVEWKPPAGYAAPAYTASEGQHDKKASVPLLAELGGEAEPQQRPVELPATEGYLGYSDRAPGQNPGHGHGHRHGAVTPEGLSPATHSQSGRGDVSPFSPSRYSEGGTY